MSYVKSSLLEGEIIIHQAKVSKWTAFWPIFWSVILGVLTVIGFLIMVPAIMRILTTEVAVTNRRIIFKTGFISRKVLILQYDRIEALELEQTVSGRLLKYGDLVLSGAGNRMRLRDIAKPEYVMKAYYQLVYPSISG